MKRKIILAVDWLERYAGSERVIQAMDCVLKFDSCVALVDIMSSEDKRRIFNGRDVLVRTSMLQIFGKFFRYLLPLFPFASINMQLNENAYLVISSSHAVAKSFHNSKCLHISYFQARNMKYIWDEQDLYFSGCKYLFRFIIPSLRRFDLRSSQKPNYIIANSYYVKDWIKKNYNRDSYVIYPPVNVTDFSANYLARENYYVYVGRIEPYKRIDLLISVFNASNDRLIIIGDGSQRKKLEKKSNANIEFEGYLTSESVNYYLRNSMAFIFPGEEDFGISIVEAQACGTPVIAYDKGGAAETVIDGETGVLFERQSTECIKNAIEKFKSIKFDHAHIRKHAEKFSEDTFTHEFKKFVEDKLLTKNST